MMKRIWLFGSLLAIVFSFLACGDDLPQFEFDPEEGLIMPDVKPITHAEFLKYAEGNGWKHVSTYEIMEDGSVDRDEYYENRDGVSSPSYYFGKDTYEVFFFRGSYPAKVRSTASYVYQEDGNRIGYVDRFTDTFFTQFQVLSISEDKLEVVRYMGVRGGKDDYSDFYGWTTFRKMSAEELEACQEEYMEESELKHDASYMFQPYGSVTEEDFMREVVGYGWQWVYTYEIADDMTYQEKDYYPDQDHAPHYYFEKDTLTRFHRTVDGTLACSREPYKLVLDAPNPLLVNEATQDTLYLFFINNNGGWDFRETLAPRDGKPVYGLSWYLRMPDYMLQKFRDKYGADK